MTIRYGNRCVGCPPRCPHNDGDGCLLVIIIFLLGLLVISSGCIENPPMDQQKPFEVQELDAALSIVVDQSGSFCGEWDDRAYDLFLELMDQFFTTSMGGETRVVIAQLSGNENTILFEGRPGELRSRFHSPAELSAFLHEHADGGGSHVYQATADTLNYVGSLQGVTENTRLLTVILSDMQDNQLDRQARQQSGSELLEALKDYQQRGGALALYFVADDEIDRWHRILKTAGFEPGMYLIENDIVENPQLPRFD